MCQVSQIRVSHEEEKLVMEVWVSSFVLTSYKSITPLSWNTAEIEWRCSVFVSCLFHSFSTHFSQEQFLWRKASSCPSFLCPDCTDRESTFKLKIQFSQPEERCLCLESQSSGVSQLPFPKNPSMQSVTAETQGLQAKRDWTLPVTVR